MRAKVLCRVTCGGGAHTAGLGEGGAEPVRAPDVVGQLARRLLNLLVHRPQIVKLPLAALERNACGLTDVVKVVPDLLVVSGRARHAGPALDVIGLPSISARNASSRA